MTILEFTTAATRTGIVRLYIRKIYFLERSSPSRDTGEFICFVFCYLTIIQILLDFIIPYAEPWKRVD